MTTTIESQASETALDLDDLRQEIAEAAQRLNVPAAQVTIVKQGKVLFAGGVGKAEVESGRGVTEHTVFAHGSTGKAFTATLVGTLVDEGLVKWDDKVRDLIPDFRLADPIATQLLTVRDLLTHRSGLPRHEFHHLAYPEQDRAEVVRRLRYMEPSKEIRELFQYCNYGFLVAGHIVEVVTGSTFEEQLRKRILEPAGMTDTVVGTAGILDVADRALPYDHKDGEFKRLNYRTMANMTPAGGLFASASDVSRWLLLQLGGGEVDGVRVISEASLKETHKLQMAMVSPLEGGMPDSPTKVNGYGFGWMIGTYRGRTYVEHGGGIDGFTTSFAQLPDEGIGVGVCGNRASGLPIAVVWQIFDRLLGLEKKDFVGVIAEQFEKMQAQAQEQGKAKKVVENAPAAHPVSAYAGAYEHPGYGTLQVAEADGKLAVTLGDIKFTTEHRHFETWDLTFEDLGQLKFELNFLTDGSGDVSGAAVNFEASINPIKFEKGADERSRDQAFLDKLAGAYTLGPVTVEVKVEAGPKLVAYQNGNRVDLEPASGLKYKVPAAPGLVLEFVMNDDETQAIAIATAQGTLTRAGSAPAAPASPEPASAPEAAPAVEDLELLAGKYSVGPVTIEIKAENGGLVLYQSGIRAELGHLGGLKYNVSIQPGLTFEFVLGEDGRAASIVSPQGTLNRTDG